MRECPRCGQAVEDGQRGHTLCDRELEAAADELADEGDHRWLTPSAVPAVAGWDEEPPPRDRWRREWEPDWRRLTTQGVAERSRGRVAATSRPALSRWMEATLGILALLFLTTCAALAMVTHSIFFAHGGGVIPPTAPALSNQATVTISVTAPPALNPTPIPTVSLLTLPTPAPLVTPTRPPARPTATPRPAPTVTPTSPAPTASPAPVATATPRPTPTPSATPSPAATPTAGPTAPP